MLNKSQLSLQALPSRQLADYLILYIIYSSNDLELLSNSFALNLKENTLEQAQVLGTGSKFGHSAQCRILLTQTSKYLTRKYIPDNRISKTQIFKKTKPFLDSGSYLLYNFYNI